METYTDLNFTFNNDEHLERIYQEFRLVEESYGIEYEELGRNGDQVCIHFTAGSDGEQAALTLMALLQKLECTFASSFTFGDEDPCYKLYSLFEDEDDGELAVYEYDCDPAYFEHLDEADDDELDESDLEAKAVGPEKHYLELYENWYEGIKPIKGQQNYRELIQRAIDYCA